MLDQFRCRSRNLHWVLDVLIDGLGELHKLAKRVSLVVAVGSTENPLIRWHPFAHDLIQMRQELFVTERKCALLELCLFELELCPILLDILHSFLDRLLSGDEQPWQPRITPFL
jgi:hypothetical protein